MLKKLSNRRLSKMAIYNRLNEIIAIALPKSKQLTFVKEIIFKLILAVAIACLTTYLILFDRHSWSLSATINLKASIIYFIGMLALGVYIYINREKKVIRHIHSIAMVAGCIWFLLQPGKVELPTNLFLSLLCIANLFVSTLTIIFSLIDNAYITFRHLERFSFDNYRYLIIEKLTKFNKQEINSALLDTKAIAEELERKIDFYKLLWVVIFIPLFWGIYIILFCQARLQIIWWFHPSIIYASILTILLSMITIFIVIDNIRCMKKVERYRLYRLILLEYDIERLKFTNSILRTELD